MSKDGCHNCKYFFAYCWTSPGAEPEYIGGLCKRRAPVTHIKVCMKDVESKPAWPEVRGADWCGDWEEPTNED